MSRLLSAAGDDANVLVIDGTGRGHALCDLFTRTNPATTVYYGPGCDVLEQERILPAPGVRLDDVGTVLKFTAAHPVDFIVVSHIEALTDGYVDALREAGLKVIGPTAAAAELEASKARGRHFCIAHGLPVPNCADFTDPDKAKAYVRSLPGRCVVKTDGLTPDGDGSVVCDSIADADEAVDRHFETAGHHARVVIEERMVGTEVSVFALLDGRHAVMLPLAMDYKRALDGDSGKNCDGMGSISPLPADTPALRQLLRTTLLDPLMNGLDADGLHFTGFVYLGVMLTAAGPRVIEINARFGDSEAQVVLPGITSDFTGLCRRVLAGELDRSEVAVDGLARCSVALVQGAVDPSGLPHSSGWPFGHVPVGQRIDGLSHGRDRNTTIFLANTQRGTRDTSRVTSGGRVLHVVGVGRSMAEARRHAYRRVAGIRFSGMRYRTDIGQGKRLAR